MGKRPKRGRLLILVHANKSTTQCGCAHSRAQQQSGLDLAHRSGTSTFRDQRCVCFRLIVVVTALHSLIAAVSLLPQGWALLGGGVLYRSPGHRYGQQDRGETAQERARQTDRERDGQKEKEKEREKGDIPCLAARVSTAKTTRVRKLSILWFSPKGWRGRPALHAVHDDAISSLKSPQTRVPITSPFRCPPSRLLCPALWRRTHPARAPHSERGKRNVTRQVGHVDAPGARAVHFSPLGTYLLTWQPPSKSVDGERPPGNLVVWSTASWSEELRLVCGWRLVIGRWLILSRVALFLLPCFPPCFLASFLHLPVFLSLIRLVILCLCLLSGLAVLNRIVAVPRLDPSLNHGCPARS